MESTLDPGVKSFLNGLDLGEYIPVFEKYGVTMKLFMSLNQDDLKVMGIKGEDMDLILKYCKKFQKSDRKETISRLKLEDVRKGVKNIDDHLRTIDVGISYVSNKFTQPELGDQMVDETSLSTIVSKVNEDVERVSKEFNETLNQLLESAEPKKEQSSTTIMVTVLVAAIAYFCYFNYARR